MPQTGHILAVDPAVDLAILQAMVDELEPYLIDDELYRTVIMRSPTGNRKLTMTGASLLSVLFRLEGEREQLAPEQQAQLDSIAAQAEATIVSLRTRFNDRLIREMKARLGGLNWYLDDCIADRGRCRANYPFEIRNRQRIEEIVKEVGDDIPNELMTQLETIDGIIRQNAQPGDFIWDEQLEKTFPRDPYWYLYMRA